MPAKRTAIPLWGWLVVPIAFGLLGCRTEYAGPMPVSRPDYQTYSGTTEEGSPYFFVVPRRFKLDAAKSTHTYEFVSPDHETLTVTFTAEATEDFLRTKEEGWKKAEPFEKIVLPAGETMTIQKYTFKKVKGDTVVASWQKGSEGGLAAIASTRPLHEVIPEVSQIVQSFVHRSPGATKEIVANSRGAIVTLPPLKVRESANEGR